MLLKDILRKISNLQSTGSDQYHAGLFPSQRVHNLTNYCREDNNIFFSALIAFTLQQLRPLLQEDLHSKINGIIDKVVANYSRYRHYADTNTYNFWQNRPKGHFPHGYLLQNLSFFALPADTDDTSLIYLTLPGKNNLANIKEKLEHHYAPNAPVSPLTLPHYTDLKAYPTFLGKKMKREMDVCVICNMLYLIFKNGLPMSSTDVDSIELIRRVLHYRDYRLNPFGVSPNYGHPAVILYHIARLVSAFDSSELANLQEPLIRCLQNELETVETFVAGLLIKTSLVRFGIPTSKLNAPVDWNRAFSNFYFFQAGMITGFQKSSLNKLARQPFFHLKYRCEAYYWTLWLEYNVLLESVQFSKC